MVDEMARRVELAKRKIANPLALAVLTQLMEAPMHPYEMASMMRERGKDLTVKLNYGSLYTVVEALQRADFIIAQDTVREGRRPERTVYEITDAGRAEARDWLRELLGPPAKEYPQFLAGLTFMPILPPAEAIEVLNDRRTQLARQVEKLRSDLASYSVAEGSRPALPRLFTIESEYELAMGEAELRWLGELLRDLESGTFDGLRHWEHFHQTQPPPAARPEKEERAERT